MSDTTDDMDFGDLGEETGGIIPPAGPIREHLFEYGMSLVSQIEMAHDQLWETATGSDLVTEAIDSRAAVIYTEVCQEMLDGKPKFSNDGARKAEAAKREAGDAMIRDLKTSATNQARIKSQALARLEALNNRLKLVRAFLQGGE